MKLKSQEKIGIQGRVLNTDRIGLFPAEYVKKQRVKEFLCDLHLLLAIYFC